MCIQPLAFDKTHSTKAQFGSPVISRGRATRCERDRARETVEEAGATYRESRMLSQAYRLEQQYRPYVLKLAADPAVSQQIEELRRHSPICKKTAASQRKERRAKDIPDPMRGHGYRVFHNKTDRRHAMVPPVPGYRMP